MVAAASSIRPPTARALTTYAKGLVHLDKLDLGRSYVSPAAAKQLQKALPNTEVLAEYPRGDQFRERYVSIGE